MRVSTLVASAAAVVAGTVALALQAYQEQPTIAGQAAPDFTATGTDGKTYSLSDVGKKAPLIMVFWKNPCPHNPRASALINSMVAAYKDKVNFVGVVNAEGDAAKAFQDRFAKEYPLLQDGSRNMIRSYKMVTSITFVVVDKDKKVESVIRGYGQEALALANAAMAKAAGAEVSKLDFSTAPARATYG